MTGRSSSGSAAVPGSDLRSGACAAPATPAHSAAAPGRRDWITARSWGIHFAPQRSGTSVAAAVNVAHKHGWDERAAVLQECEVSDDCRDRRAHRCRSRGRRRRPTGRSAASRRSTRRPPATSPFSTIPATPTRSPRRGRAPAWWRRASSPWRPPMCPCCVCAIPIAPSLPSRAPSFRMPCGHRHCSASGRCSTGGDRPCVGAARERGRARSRRRRSAPGPRSAPDTVSARTPSSDPVFGSGAIARSGPAASLMNALIGDRVIVHPGVRIGQDGFGFVMGAAGHVKVPQIGRVIIQDDVEIGAGTTIDRGGNPRYRDRGGHQDRQLWCRSATMSASAAIACSSRRPEFQAA